MANATWKLEPILAYRYYDSMVSTNNSLASLNLIENVNIISIEYIFIFSLI